MYISGQHKRFTCSGCGHWHAAYGDVVYLNFLGAFLSSPKIKNTHHAYLCLYIGAAALSNQA